MSRRVAAGAVLAALVAAALVIVGVGERWGSTLVREPAPLPAHVYRLSGAQSAAGGRALAWVVLAGLLAALAVRRRARTVLAGVSVGAAAGCLALCAGAAVDVAARVRSAAGPGASAVHQTGWPWVTVAAAAVALVAAAACVPAVRRWRGLGGRYDRPQAAPPPADPSAAAWAAIDRGEDPTVDGAEI
jgi:uncharacterized membrane protein (TIGR02234 family)